MKKWNSFLTQSVTIKHRQHKSTPAQQIPRGGALVFWGGFHPCEKTFKTHPKHIISKYENTPYLHVFCMFLHFL